MDALRAMRIFVRVIDEGSFAGAARALDLAPAVVTRLIAELEDHLGARLMHRTTRRIALTRVGETYLERVRQILADIDEAEAATTAAASEPRGHVRLLTPASVAVHQLARHLPRFRAQFPQVTLEVVTANGVDTVDENCDLTLLVTRKTLEGPFIARRLARAEVIACATPEYLDLRGRPSHPAELEDHDVLIPPVSDIQRGITFFRGEPGSPGAEQHLSVPRSLGPLSTLNVDMNYAAVLAGLGIAGLPSFVIDEALMEGALERVLPQWRVFAWDLWLCMPTRRHVPARTRALQEFLIGIFGGEDRDPWLAAAGCETCPEGGPPPCRGLRAAQRSE